MGRRTTTTIIALGLLVASPLMARKLTTTQMRENTIRINALEIEEPAPEPVPEPQPQPQPEPQPEEPGWVFDSGRLNFDFDKSVVKPQYFELLRNVKDYAEQKDLKLTIIGHTDSKGSDAYNMALGMRRAVAVRDKLIEFGLDPARILGVESRGESEPIAPNDTDQGRFENRRIEFKATK